jgi:hypothetical protein
MLVFFGRAIHVEKKYISFLQVNGIVYPPDFNRSLYLDKQRIAAFTNYTHQVQSRSYPISPRLLRRIPCHVIFCLLINHIQTR